MRWVSCAIGVIVFASGVSSASADTRLFPIISISQQYDSNVFYAPESALAPGLKPDDFVTFVNPQLLIAHTSPSFTGSLSLGAVIGKYINNPDLDFVGFNASATIDLRRVVQRISSKFTSFSVIGAYQYTPSASAFGAGGVGFGGVGFGTAGAVGSGAIGPFDSGLVSNRAEITSYSGTASGSYALSPVTTLQFAYTYSQISFGGQFGVASEAQQNQLFDTTAHSLTGGVNRQTSPNDSLGLTYSYSTFDQQGVSSFGTHTAAGTWFRRWTREANTVLTGGATLTEPFDDLSTGTPQKVPATVQPTGSAVLSWSSASSVLRSVGEGGGAFGGRMETSPMLAAAAAAGSMGGLPGVSGSVMPGMILGRGRYSVALSYNFAVFPSFVAEAGPMLTHVVGAQGSFGMTDRVTGQLGLNFARSIGSIRGPQSSVFAYDTYGATAGLNYLVTPNLMGSLSYTWLTFLDQSPNPSAINSGNQIYEFSKHMVMISLSYVFTQAQGFFRSGGLGPSSGGGAGSVSPGTGTGSGFGKPEKGLK